MTGRKSQIPTGHLEHSPCHKVCASDAVQSVDNTAARPNDPRRQTAGRVVSVCVCTCAITLRMYVTFWQLQMSIAAHLFAFVCVCVCVCVCVYMQYQSHSPQPFMQGNGRETQIPIGHLEHSPCHKVWASDAVQNVNNTAACPKDPKRQTAGRVVPVCVCVCMCVHAVPIPLTSTFCARK